MPDGERAWLALAFEDPVKRWVREYQPSLPALRAVRDWIRSREVDPFAGVRLEYTLSDRSYFFGAIPGTMTADGRVVTCSYWVFPADGTVRCDMLSTASWPV